MRISCEFKNKTLTAAVNQVIATLLDVQIVSIGQFAEVIVTDDEDLIGDSSKNFVLATFSDLEITADNVTVVKQPIQLPDVLMALENFRKHIDVNKQKVLIFNPHHVLNQGYGREDLEHCLYGQAKRFDVDYQSTCDFETFSNYAKRAEQYGLVLVDPFHSLADFSKKSAEKVNAVIKSIKSLVNPPVILVEECEGYEKSALEAGADGIISDWGKGTIAQTINQYLPVKTSRTLKEIKPEDLIGGKIMKILVVDDNPKHRASARETLAGHEITIAFNFHQAQAFLNPKPDYDEVERITEEKGITWKEAKKLATPKFEFDVVLSDLLMPKGSDDVMGTKGQKFIYDEMAYGYPIAVLAAKASVPLIAVVTDTNHHDHPMAYTFDLVGGYEKYVGGYEKYDDANDFITKSRELKTCGFFLDKHCFAI